MANRRTISWSTAMRDLRHERTRRAGVSEERLRATAGLRHASLALSVPGAGAPGGATSSGVHPLDEAEILEVTDAVILAVRRDDDGTAHVIDVATAGSQPSDAARTRWMARVRERGATEMHVHRLADGDRERRRDHRRPARGSGRPPEAPRRACAQTRIHHAHRGEMLVGRAHVVRVGARRRPGPGGRAAAPPAPAAGRHIAGAAGRPRRRAPRPRARRRAGPAGAARDRPPSPARARAGSAPSPRPPPPPTRNATPWQRPPRSRPSTSPGRSGVPRWTWEKMHSER